MNPHADLWTYDIHREDALVGDFLSGDWPDPEDFRASKDAHTVVSSPYPDDTTRSRIHVEPAGSRTDQPEGALLPPSGPVPFKPATRRGDTRDGS